MRRGKLSLDGIVKIQHQFLVKRVAKQEIERNFSNLIKG